MTTSEKGNQAREAVGVFGDADAMQKAIEELLSSGFKHADLSLLASEETVDKKLGHKYKKVTEIEDNAAVPRIRYVSQDAIAEGEYVFTGGDVFTRMVVGFHLSMDKPYHRSAVTEALKSRFR